MLVWIYLVSFVIASTQQVFVDSEAAPGGQGGENNPFNSLQDALVAQDLTSSSVFIVKGTHSLGVQLNFSQDAKIMCKSNDYSQIEWLASSSITTNAELTIDGFAFSFQQQMAQLPLILLQSNGTLSLQVRT